MSKAQGVGSGLRFETRLTLTFDHDEGLTFDVRVPEGRALLVLREGDLRALWPTIGAYLARKEASREQPAR
jgi:hypothetical protein